MHLSFPQIDNPHVFSWAWIFWDFKGLKSCHIRTWSGFKGSNKAQFCYMSLQSHFRLLFDMIRDLWNITISKFKHRKIKRFVCMRKWLLKKKLNFSYPFYLLSFGTKLKIVSEIKPPKGNDEVCGGPWYTSGQCVAGLNCLKKCGKYHISYLIDAVTSSGILKAKQKLGLTFNFDKQDVIDLMNFSKMTMCRASESNSKKYSIVFGQKKL